MAETEHLELEPATQRIKRDGNFILKTFFVRFNKPRMECVNPEGTPFVVEGELTFEFGPNYDKR